MIKRGENGFTLIEVLISIVLFSTVLLLFSTYFVNSFSQSKRQDHEQIAITIAKQFAEQWKNEEGDISPTNVIVKDKKGKVTSLPLNLLDKSRLNYDDLFKLIDYSFVLPSEKINERNYEPHITIYSLNRDPNETTDPNPLILIEVSIFSTGSNQSLATLTTAIGHHTKG